MRTGFLVTSVLLAMSACVEWPDVETPLASRQLDRWPELQPTATLPTPVTDAEEQLASTSLRARAAALRRRALLLRTPVADMDDFERLRAALAR